MMRETLIMTETRIRCWRRGAAPLEESVAIVQTHDEMLELHVLHHQMSIGTEGLVSDVYKFRASLQW